MIGFLKGEFAADKKSAEIYRDEWEGKLKIFKNTGLHSVFFGEQISGPSMPSLAYMLAFKSMEERNINWEKFSKDPDW